MLLWSENIETPLLQLTLAILGNKGISKVSVSTPFTVRSSISLTTAQTGSGHRVAAELCCKI